jgi:hypothetical protein
MKKRVRDQWQLALYIPPDLAKQLKAEARRQNRANAPTVLQIMREYFSKKEADASEQRPAQ